MGLIYNQAPQMRDARASQAIPRRLLQLQEEGAPSPGWCSGDVAALHLPRRYFYHAGVCAAGPATVAERAAGAGRVGAADECAGAFEAAIVSSSAVATN